VKDGYLGCIDFTSDNSCLLFEILSFTEVDPFNAKFECGLFGLKDITPIVPLDELLRE
jgi:hypothetical protein